MAAPALSAAMLSSSRSRDWLVAPAQWRYRLCWTRYEYEPADTPTPAEARRVVDDLFLGSLAVRDEPTGEIDYSPGSFGCHEALHMASVLMEMVDERLCEHPAVQQRVEWVLFAEMARRSLFDLYQAIGAEHLKERDDQASIRESSPSISGET